MSAPWRVAMVASEMFPFAKSGGLGDVLGALPSAMRRAGCEVCVFLPAYRSLLEGGRFGKPLLASLPDAFGGLDVRYSLFRTEHEGVIVFALRCGGLFDRAGFYEDAGREFGDNALRFSRFCRGVLSAIEYLGLAPEILHCHDWQAALAPALVRTRRAGHPAWARTGTVLTVHNLAYQGRFGGEQFVHTGLPLEAFSVEGLEFYSDVNFLKGGLVFADAISTVSRTYALEIQTPEQGEGLEGIISRRASDLFGIMNGVDCGLWDPSEDPWLPAGFSAGRMEGKVRCREVLREAFGLRDGARGPLCVMVTRLVPQKGLELVLESLDDLLALDIQLAVLGTGMSVYADALAAAAERHRGRVAFRPAFDEGLAHLLYAGGEVLFMPSRYEPAGLNQLYAMRYGTLPVVRAVGGLADTVVAHREIDPEWDTGFRFEEFRPAEFVWAVVRACRAFSDPALWGRLVRNAMACDFGWDRVAPGYLEMYRGARDRRAARP